MGGDTRLKVMVLAGGPDRERPVSLQSGATVAAGLRAAGHDVIESDILPDDLSALDRFVAWGGQVIFPILHGAWGEGGGLQRLMEQRGLAYVGCRSAAAELCMDKHRTKLALRDAGLPTPGYELVARGGKATLSPPVVVKPLCEGSSIDVVICKDAAKLERTLAELFQRHKQLMVERFVSGLELTVGVVGTGKDGEYQALPVIQIIPATEFYDYEAKYTRDDTQYRFDIPLPGKVIEQMREQAVRAFLALGCRHLSRVDFLVDQASAEPFILEINTLPGFTSHSLVPMGARKAGIEVPVLVDRLARMALAEAKQRA